MTRSAFCQARKKLSHRVFIELLDLIGHFVDQHRHLKTFRGFRVFAVDGSTVRPPDNPKNCAHFGSMKVPGNRLRAMARWSVLFDVLNRLTYDAIFENYSIGETNLAWAHFQNLDWSKRGPCLFLLDRGYASFHLLHEILDQGLHFCVRMKSNSGVVKALLKEQKSEIVTLYRPSSEVKRGLPKNSPLLKPIPVRVTSFHFGGAEPVYVMTTLSVDQATPAELSWLYHQRWQIEESYKVKKCRLMMEEFSGESPEIVLQDFHGKIFTECLTAALSLDLAPAIAHYSEGKKYNYQVSMTQCLAKMKNTIGLLFLRKKTTALLEQIGHIFMKSLDAIVPNRKAKRKASGKCSPKLQGHSHAYRRNR